MKNSNNSIKEFLLHRNEKKHALYILDNINNIKSWI